MGLRCARRRFLQTFYSLYIVVPDKIPKPPGVEQSPRQNGNKSNQLMASSGLLEREVLFSVIILLQGKTQ